MAMKSMTGYGQGCATFEQAAIKAEIRSVNNRFLDVSVRTPPGFMKYEQKIKDLVSVRVSRGKIDVFVSAPPTLAGTTRVLVDESLVSEFINALKRLAEKYGLADDVSLEMLADFRPAFCVETTSDTKEVWDPIMDCVNRSLDQLVQMRENEGANLQAKVTEQIKGLRQDVKGLERDLTGGEQRIRDRLLEFVRTQCEMPELDSDRLEQEVALLLVKSDISEEMARLASHLNQFEALSEALSPVGKQLTFLCQEMLREVNVISSKSQSKEVSSRTIGMKSRIEIIREQLNNIE